MYFLKSQILRGADRYTETRGSVTETRKKGVRRGLDRYTETPVFPTEENIYAGNCAGYQLLLLL